ncbi:hypothetical protein NHX12_003863 [Muraenolepis orangiensis]|uniref:Fibronectin type-III domain-containing protein n=1 Tax=Muraenolepis orangiensis TaxID=630683 RepID=A0A9Q0DVP4_9TELE|nr:hypothetical protein NHX12_003863 [Muraenolepis orangiensis]
MAGQSERTLVLAALGRPFSLGMLYDCLNDSLVPAFTLWDRQDLEKEAVETLQPYSSFDIVASDSIEDKSNALNVEASLKASFLCGLIQVEGAAKYISDCKTSRNPARVTLQYKNTTKFQQLSMNHIGRGNVKHSYVFESGKATHVVTGILYGSHAFFVLDREVSEKEDRQEIEGNLKVLIRKMPTLNIDGKGALKMRDADFAKVDKFSCRFHGDFHLERHPVSFQEAIEVYQSLPTLLGSNGKNTVPQKVWLMPLKNLDSAAAQLVRQISDRLISDAQNTLEDLAFTLWDRQDLEKEAVETLQPNSSFDIVASDSIEDKSNALNVEASLKASFLCGLIEVEGAAKYLLDCKTSRNQARVTLQYKNTTKFQQLSMNHIGRGNVKHPYVFESGLATHVVTGILYGSHAFFVLDREVSEEENRRDIEGNLKVLIWKIHMLDIKGEGALKMEDADFAKVDKFSCKFHGDFHLERHPVSFQEAIEVYQSLPTLLGSNGKNTVPQKFKLEFQKTMARKLPLIRGGGEEEGTLGNILKSVQSSPFNSIDLNEWMDCKETESKIISSLVDNMLHMTLVTSRSSRDATHTVSFVFTSLETPEPYLSALSNYLDEANKPDYVPCKYDVDKEQWFFSDEEMDKVQQKIKLFTDFAEANRENRSIRFLTAAVRDDEKKGAIVRLYTDGSSVNDNFEPPSKPTMITCGITHNSVTLNISPPRFGLAAVINYAVEVYIDDVWLQHMECQAGDVTVSGLKSDEEYRFWCRAMCAVGLGPACEASALIKTLSPPQQGEFDGLAEIRVATKWKELAVKLTPGSWQTPKRLAEAVKRKARKVNGPQGALDVYSLRLVAHPMEVDGCRRFALGEDNMVKPNRTIMVLGATGSGKSTLVNGMINYILGVKWEDKFRFKLVDENTARSQAHSQTSEVTVYKLNHREGFQIDYSLTIVDTPGFGDTRGIERDRMIIGQLENLFKAPLGVITIDAICFVAQASLPHLTPTQRYVFDSVLSIFGNNVADNIRILVTFADDQLPPVLTAINESGAPCPKRKDGLPVHFKFNNSALFANNEVAEDDEDGEGNFDKMFWAMGTKCMKNFFAALNIIETKSLTLTKEVLRQRGQLENTIENLQKKVKLGLAKLEEIKQESQILQTHKATITANGKAIEPMKQMRVQYDVLQEEVLQLMESSTQCLNRLKKIALKPNPLSTLEYIDLLIQGEKSESNEGYLQRIQKLQEIREKAVTMEKVSRGVALLE